MKTKKGITKLVVGAIIAVVAVGVFALVIATTQTTSKPESNKEDVTTTLSCEQSVDQNGYKVTANIDITYVNDNAKVILMKEVDEKETAFTDEEVDEIEAFVDDSYASWNIERPDEKTIVINAELKTDSEAGQQVQHREEAKTMFEERSFVCK